MKIKLKETEIVPVMIGTAGHVDHGKTSLVKLLTGCETDCLKEEKERGLSIDLGFAPCALSGNKTVGIIDVPGHLDFIRNMVAGATSIDILMLVVAADDSIMPQTKEHLQIVKLLRAPQLMVVVTKIDLVDEEMLELVMEEIEEFTQEAGYSNAPILPMSNVTLDGISNVRKEIEKVVENVSERYDKRAFRMNIERVFSIKGYGTVVTGIPSSGEVSIDDKVVIYPSEKESRVRAIQNYKQKAETTGSNYCTAINLVDISKEDVKRGMTLSLAQGNYKTSKFILAEINNEGSSYKIKQNMEVRIHYGTANVLGKISLMSKKELKLGEKDFAKIRFKEPLFLVAGDKFIIRQLSPSITLGGGTVLNISQQKVKKHRLHLNEAMLAFENKDFFMMELLSSPQFLYTKNDLIALTHYVKEEDSEKVINSKLEFGEIIDLGEGAYLIKSKLAICADDLKKKLLIFHKAKPTSWGLDIAEYANIYKVKAGNFAKYAKLLSEFDKEINYSYQRLALTSFEPAISKQDFLLLEKIILKVEKAGIAAPAIGDLVTEFKSNKKDFNKLIKILSEEGKIITIGKNILFKKVFNDCKNEIISYFNENEFLEINDFRELTGASRNFSVSLLEKFDALGITRQTRTNTDKHGRTLCGNSDTLTAK